MTGCRGALARGWTRSSTPGPASSTPTWFMNASDWEWPHRDRGAGADRHRAAAQALRPRQGPRHLRADRRPAADGGHGPHLRVRPCAPERDPGPGQGADAALHLLVLADRHVPAQPPDLRHGPGPAGGAEELSRGAGGAVHDRAQGQAHRLRVRGPRLPRRERLEGVRGVADAGGEKMPPGLRQSEKLAAPIFSPATKAESGHDENITFEQMKKELGDDLAMKLRAASLELYNYASEFSARRGLILADTKFEFGTIRDEVILIDEALTPDSSRYWEAQTYAGGTAPDSYDKQFVR